MDARAYDRMAAVMSVSFLLALAAGSYYLAVWAGREQTNDVRVRSNEPDVFVENVLLTEVDREGRAVFRMSARDMRHFPIDRSSEFNDPRLISLDPSRPKLIVMADKATMLTNGEEAVLSGNVRMQRQGAPGDPELRVFSEQMIVNGHEETARTNRAVEVLQGEARLTGVGMEFDNVSRALTVSSRVKALFPPQLAPAAGPAPSDQRPERLTPKQSKDSG